MGDPQDCPEQLGRPGSIRTLIRRGAQSTAYLYRSWCTHRGGALAAELLLFALLSALPILLCISALLGGLDWLTGPETAGQIEESVRSQVIAVLGDATPVLDLIGDLFAAPSGRALTVGLVFAVYGAGRGFVSLVGSLDVIFSTSSARGWLAQRLVGLALSSATLVVLPLALASSYASRSLAGHLADGPVAKALINHLLTVAGAALTVVWLTTIYHLAPRDRLRWRDHLFGAAVCVALGGALTRVFRLLLPYLGANLVFGVIGAVISLLWWGYAVCCAFFIGAEINLLMIRRGPRDDRPAGRLRPGRGGGRSSR